MIKVNIYYGGRGLIEDPANYVMNKLIQVLEELNIQVKKYNLYEDIRGISVLPKTLKNTDAVILVASIEWLGIGGLLQQFLDSCWLYGDKETLKRLYMMPVAISTTYGEKEAYTTLIKAWELLGGKPCDGISAYVNNTVDFETNSNYAYLIEKKAENFYRTFSKKIISFPSSTNAVLDNVAQPKSMNLTPQESEQLSMYVSNDKYVKKQKADIEELSQMFRGLMGDEAPSSKGTYIETLESHFHAVPDITLAFSIEITDKNNNLVIEIENGAPKCYYGQKARVNVKIKTSSAVLDKIFAGERTLQGTFMAGELTAKGDFKILRMFDSLFQFKR